MKKHSTGKYYFVNPHGKYFMDGALFKSTNDAVLALHKHTELLGSSIYKKPPEFISEREMRL